MKKNGFVFMETLVVVSVLTLTLVLLFSSYSYILTRTRERNEFDTTETIYKVNNIKKILKKYSSDGTVLGFIKNNSLCSKMGSYDSYKCDLTKSDVGSLFQIKNAYEVEKLYYVNPYTLISNTTDTNQTWMLLFDATTIDYIRNLGKNVNKSILIVKFKKTYDTEAGEYEVINASDARLEV